MWCCAPNPPTLHSNMDFCIQQKGFLNSNCYKVPFQKWRQQKESLFCRSDSSIAPTYCHYKQSHIHMCPYYKRKEELWLPGQHDLWKNRKLGETSWYHICEANFWTSDQWVTIKNCLRWCLKWQLQKTKNMGCKFLVQKDSSLLPASTISMSFPTAITLFVRGWKHLGQISKARELEMQTEHNTNTV